MIELLSLALGGVLRLAPELFKMFGAKRDADHEFRMTELQLQIDRERAQQNLDLVHAQGAIAADSAEMMAMVEALKAQAVPTGVKWVDALSASVRPILTYWWCLFLYTIYKAVTISLAIASGASLATLAGLLVTEFDRSVIGSIFAFWFVDRSLRK